MARPRPETGGTFTSPTKTILNQLGEEVEVFTTGPQAGKDAEGNIVIQQADQTSQPFVTGDTKPDSKVPPKTPAPIPTEDDIETKIKKYTSEFLAKMSQDEKTAERLSAYNILKMEFDQYGLGSLVEDIKSLLIDKTPTSEFGLRLRGTDAYKARFKGNEARIAAGLSALSPGDYVALEDQYQNIMRNYGLPKSYYTKDSTGKQVGFETFIGADVSATELENRIMTAQTRVINANPQVSQALKQFYPDITNGDILAYTLDPKNALKDIQNKVTSAEIGGAAFAAGLNLGKTPEQIAASKARAEMLQGYGVTKDQAMTGFQTVAESQPRGTQLSGFYNRPTYDQMEAEQDVFNLEGAVASRKKRKEITGLEKAAFGGQTGLTAGALNRDRAGGY